MHDIREGIQAVSAIRPQTGSTAYNGEYFSMEKFAKAWMVVHANGQLNGADMVLKVYEAVDATGSGTPQQLGADITMAQGIKLTMAIITVDAGNSTVDDTFIITPYTFVNGVVTAGTALTFTAKAAESLANRQFDQSGTAAEEATSIGACINDATYGIPGVLATVADTVVTLTMDEPGDGMFTIVESNVTALVVTDLVQQADLEVAVQDLDRDDDFTHIQARLSGVASGDVVSVTLIRAVPGYQPVGQVSAYTDDAS